MSALAQPYTGPYPIRSHRSCDETGLTERQAQVLALLRSSPRTPSYREIMAATGVKSTARVSQIILALEERGFITRIPNRSRTIRVVPDGIDLSAVPTAALVAELRGLGVVGVQHGARP